MQEGIIDPGLDRFRQAAHILAKFGREGDTYVVHAAEGETVIPVEVLDANPKMKKMLFEQMEEMGLQPDRYIVGNEFNSINPVTGQPEFFFKSIVKAVKKTFKKVKEVVKKVAPVILPLAAPFIFTTMPAFLASGLGSFGGAMLGGASVKDALKSGIMAGVTAGAANKFLGGGSFFGSRANPNAGFGDAMKSMTSGEAFTPSNPFSGIFGGGAPSGSVKDAVKDTSTLDAFKDTGVKNLKTDFTPPSDLSTGIKPDADLGFFEKYIYNPADNVAGITDAGEYATTGESFLEKYLSPNRTNIDPTAQAYQKAIKLQDVPTKLLSDTAKQEAMNKLAVDAATAEAPGIMAKYMPLGSVVGGGALVADALMSDEPDDEPEGPSFEEMSNERYAEAMQEMKEDGSAYTGKYAGGTSDYDTRASNFDELLRKYGFLGDDDDEVRTQPIAFAASGGEIVGPGTPTSDSIPAMLSDGEFVMNAQAVRGAGGGDRNAGAKKMYQMMRQLEGRA